MTTLLHGCRGLPQLPASPVVKGVSKRKCFHVVWRSVVTGHNPTLSTLTILFVTVVFLMAEFEMPSGILACKCWYVFLVKIWGWESQLKFQFQCGYRDRVNQLSCGPWEMHHKCGSPPLLCRTLVCTWGRVLISARASWHFAAKW